MSMQNLTTSANFPMFSKVHQDAVPSSHAQPSPRTNASQSVSAGDAGEQPGKGPQGQLSAADLHQMMLSQLDQQLYLSQLAGLGASSDASVAAAPATDSSASSVGALNPFQHFPSSIDIPTSSVAVCHASDSATTTTSSASSTSSAADGKSCSVTGSGGMYSADLSAPSSDLIGQQLAHQKLMEQFLEVATTVAGGGGSNQQVTGGNTTPSAEEMMVNQLMAQLVNGTSVPKGSGTETHEQMTPQHQMGTALAHQQQNKNDCGTQSPTSSSHNQHQMPMSLLDQLQLLQMLGSSGANPQSLPGFADLFAAGGLPPSTSSENLAQLLKGVGGAGGSPSKAEQVYCELCDKWLCNRYFMKTHMLKKHGIGETASNTNSPLKNGVGNFSFASSAQFSADEHSVRPNSASVQPPQMEMMAQQNESPPVGRLAPKLSLSSTPGTMGGNPPGDNATTAFNEALSPDHSQQMAMVQQLAAQLGLTNGGNSTEGERNALFEQIFGNGGVHLAELIAQAQNQQQNSDMTRGPSPSSVRSPPAALSGGSDHHHHAQQNVPSSSAAASSFVCAQCAKHFPSQSALFQHQLTVHIGGTDGQQPQQQSAANNDTHNQSTVNALAMLAAAGINGGNEPTQQQQQLFGQLLGSNPFSHGTTPSLLFNNPSAFAGINPTDFDGAAILAKLSAEFAAVAQAQHGQSGAISSATAQSVGGPAQQNGAMGRGHTPAPPNKPPPQKRQYSSTSKNFCDLCNKEVCNKYFLRTHMLKMHNIIIDENKQLIANIDTVDKERKGEVKFRCDICHTSMNTREELKLHKRESHGLHAGGGAQSTPLSRGAPKASSASQSATVSMETSEANQQQQQPKMGILPSFAPTLNSHFNATEHHQTQQQQQSTQRRTTGGEGATAGANDENNQPPGEHQPQQTSTRDSGAAVSHQTPLVGANPMKQLLSLIGGAGGEEALPPSLVSGARLLRTTGATNNAKKESEDGQLGHRIADANNNATNCRFCGLCLEAEGQLQLHQLIEHHNELAELQPTLNLPHSASTEDKLINQVALQMAEANSHHHQHHQHPRKFPQQRKASVASSGASSSSAASSGDVGTAQPLQQQQKTKKGIPSRGEKAVGDGGGERHQCPQCKRTYKSAQKMEEHQRIVHHNFVGKFSPSKRSIISPKKIAKLMSSFSCHKCRRRFSSRVECDEHTLSHIRSERIKREEADDEQPQEEGAQRAPQAKRAKMGEDDEGTERRQRDGVGTVGVKTDTGEGLEEEGQQRTQRRTKSTGGGEKHSHTSGSTSPVSVQAGSSGGALPEGFAHPLLDHTRPFVLQTFTLRPISPHSSCQLPDELVAYLPVRSTLGQPIRVTFELNPTPHMDQQVQHL